MAREKAAGEEQTRTPKQRVRRVKATALHVNDRQAKIASKGRNQKTAGSGAFAKVSVSIPADVVREARERAGQSGLSAYVTGAVEAQLAQERLRDMLAELDATFGPVAEELVAEADAAWPSE